MGSLFKAVLPIAAAIVAPQLAPAVAGATGLSTTAASAITGAALGGASGLATGGGLKGALTGAAMGGAGGYVSGSGGLANAAQNLGLGTVSSAGTAGTGIAGALSSGAGSILGKVIDGAGGVGNVAGNIYSGIQGTEAYKDMAKAQTAATNKAIDAAKPYLTSGLAANTQLSGLLGLNGEDNDDILEMLRNSPGYQFRMTQGQDALNKSLSARGMVFSGNALREAQELGQGLADQTYNDYVDDLYRTSSAGQAAASNLGGLYQDTGNIKANSIMGQNNTINNAIAGVLGGTYSPLNAEKEIVGYDPTTGKPIYR